MFDFIQDTLGITSQILMLAFVGLLVFLCIRTRSKGLIIITAVLIFPPTFGLIPNYIITSLKWTHCRGQNIGKISKIIKSCCVLL